MKYFTATNLDELKAQYRRLCKIHHPDAGGSTEVMQAINAEHDELFEILKREQNARAEADPTGKTRYTTETPEEFRTIIEHLLRFPDLVVELCGCWLWISGETKAHKEELKAMGCQWSRNKQAWYWHHKEDGVGWTRRKTSMGYIRNKYGSQTFTKDGETYSRPVLA